MEKIFQGPVLLLQDNVDTDQIFPGRLLEITNHEEMGKHCFWGIDERIALDFPKGGIIVAGKNFGCGSSREHAAIAIQNMGASMVIAESFARIFYRNGINLGLPLVECKGISNRVHNGEIIKVDLEKGYVETGGTGEKYKVEPFSDYILSILDSGGVKPFMRERFKKRGDEENDQN